MSAEAYTGSLGFSDGNPASLGFAMGDCIPGVPVLFGGRFALDWAADKLRLPCLSFHERSRDVSGLHRSAHSSLDHGSGFSSSDVCKVDAFSAGLSDSSGPAVVADVT